MSTSFRLPDEGREWVARVRAGDERAFESLFRALAPGLCALATRYVGSRSVAEELVQDLFLDVWTRRESLHIEQTISAYLYTAVRHRALNHVRRERGPARVRDTSFAMHPDDPDPRAPGASELLDALEIQDAIDRLPARCRLVFTLHRQQDMSYGEIATSLGLSIKTVETQMGRALKSLRERLKHLLP